VSGVTTDQLAISGWRGRLRQASIIGSAFAAALFRPRRRVTQPRLLFVYSHFGAAARYRALHQAEQARFLGWQAEAIVVDDLQRLYHFAAYDLIILHRVPLTSRTLPLMILARWRRIPVLFDSDDLVWDEREREYNFLDRHYSAEVVEQILLTIRRLRAAMQRADAFIFSTPVLAEQAQRDFAKPSFVNRNALSAEQLSLAEAAYAKAQPKSSTVVIGYFCGTPRVHDEDLASIAPALARVMERCPQLRLRFYGEVALPSILGDAFAERIERHAAVPWDQLASHLAALDINIAPLIDNPQRRAKSAVKYLEAALLRVPTVASNLPPYNDVMIHQQNGLLAGNLEEWESALQALVEQAELRERLGYAAYAHALAEHSTNARASQFAALINQILDRQSQELAAR
jgi:glycosyltransferase involved in cell wall biosynthesis